MGQKMMIKEAMAEATPILIKGRDLQVQEAPSALSRVPPTTPGRAIAHQAPIAHKQRAQGPRGVRPSRRTKHVQVRWSSRTE